MPKWLPDPDKHTAIELVAFAITATICLILILSMTGAILIELLNPEEDTTIIWKYVTNTVSILIGAIVGFISGRTIGSNGKDNKGGVGE